MNLDIETLQSALPKLGQDDRRFAESLLKQSERRTLSDKQMHWVKKLTERAVNPPFAPVAVGDVAGVVALLATARTSGLKWPRLLLRAGKITLRLSIAGDKSKHPGNINVTARDGGDWYGRISKAGEYLPSRSLEGATAIAIAAALTALAADPAGVAAEYGRLTGECCFCASPLSDARSTAVGYGPVCAAKWGLPWGAAH